MNRLHISYKKVALINLFMLLFFIGNAQQSILQQQITIKFKKVTVADALLRLKQERGLNLSYSNDQIQYRVITVDFKNETVEKVLRYLLGKQYVITVLGEQILIYPDKHAKYTFSGWLRDAATKEYLIGAIVTIPTQNAGTVTNHEGYFTFTLHSDTFTVNVNYIGYKSRSVFVNLLFPITQTIELQSNAVLNEFVLSELEGFKQKSPGLSQLLLETREVEKLPVLLGEKDAVRYFQLMPGIQKGNEGDNSLYVRGGNHDQNLVLLDDAVLYNTSHATGLFSLFTGSEIKRAELSKGAFSAKYGGRASSVLDVSLKDGNKTSHSGEVTAGLISSKLSVEGPLLKNKVSYLFSARRTYIDYLLKPFEPLDAEESSFYFYDINMKVSADVGKNGKLSLSTYIGGDKYGVNDESDGVSLSWGNRMISIKYTKLINPKLFFSTSVTSTKYYNQFGLLFSNNAGPQKNEVKSSITDYSYKADLEYLGIKHHVLKTGLQITHHNLRPQALALVNSLVNQNPPRYEANALEGGWYIEDIFEWNQRLKVISGLRISYFGNSDYHYINPEPRITAQYSLPHQFQIAASSSIMNQYLNSIRVATYLLPVDVWLPVTQNNKPLTTFQNSISIKKVKNKYEFALEGYYKYTNNAYMASDGLLNLRNNNADLNSLLNVLLSNGTASAWGIECLLRKTTGRFNGWISYTYSRVWMNYDNLNAGRNFPARFDRPHDIGINMSYQITKKWISNVTWVYGTGTPISLPVGGYYNYVYDPITGQLVFNSTTRDYEGKNEFRMIAYHRIDFSVQYHSKLFKGASIVEFGAFNAYNRRNAWVYSITTVEGINRLTKTTFLPLIPSLSWTYKF